MIHSLQEFLVACKSKYPNILVESAELSHLLTKKTVFNSNELKLESTTAHYSFTIMFSPKQGEKVASFNYLTLKLADLNIALIQLEKVTRLFDEAILQLDKEKVNKKWKGKVILSPSVVVEMLHFFKMHISANYLLDGSSLFPNHIEKKITSDKITVSLKGVSDSLVAKQFFTNDGITTVEGDLIKEGVLKNYLLTSYSSNKLAKSLFANDGNIFTIAPGEKALDEMIKSVEDGIFVNRFSGGYPNSKGDFSGLAKNSFRIQNGKRTNAIEETMIAANLFDMFNSTVTVSKECDNTGGVSAPWFLVDGVTISG
jgi:PmbA protein